MKIFYEKDKTVIVGIENFDCNQVFGCGQCFRWRKIIDVNSISQYSYTGTVFGKTITLNFEKNNLILREVNKEDFENIWKDYFDLETDYKEINRKISEIDPVLDRCLKKFSGIRILRQDPWEVLCSFIISQNNNIPRIKRIISDFCNIFGENFSFPGVEIIAKLTLGDLKLIKCGFRAKYILDAAKKISSGELNFDSIKKLSNEKARKELMRIYGVGQKVADCTLLFGFHRLDVFPLDVWMKRVMEKYFPDKTSEFFGKYAGVAQQYLFHNERTIDKKI